MIPHDPVRGAWRTSSRSSGNGNCVEVATGAASVAVRDSKDRGGPVLAFAGRAWHAFLTDLDRLAQPPH